MDNESLLKTDFQLPADHVAGGELYREVEPARPLAAPKRVSWRERALSAVRAVRARQLAWALALALLALLVAFDRGRWADVAQWREDQACNLWLGYTQSLFYLPVGLISSVGTPNPNGMPLLAAMLSLLPNLWAISFALGMMQALLVMRIAWVTAGPRPLFLVLALPGLASVVMRGTSVEFWNQWVLTTMNLAFFALWVGYLRRPSPWALVGFLGAMLYAPALYLAGAVNSFVYLAFAVAALWIRPLRHDPRRQPLPLLAAIALLVFALDITWLPYLHESSRSAPAVPPLTYHRGLERLQHALEAFLGYPTWLVEHWFNATLDSFLQGGESIIGRRMVKSVRRMEALLLCQGALCVFALLLAIGTAMRARLPFRSVFRVGMRTPGQVLIGCLLFPMSSLVLSSLLGGPDWTSGDRSDQQVQFLPFQLFASFALPFVVSLPRAIALGVRAVTGLMLLGFCLVSARDGLKIVDSHLNYRGSAITHADVPLAHQRQAAAFIAHDWMAMSSDKRVPVVYRHGQEWVTGFGEKLKRWYPAPMTVGRAIDFELSRAYGLRNSQEGVQARTLKDARYMVTYGFQRAPKIRGVEATHTMIGRLRVSIFDPRPR